MTRMIVATTPGLTFDGNGAGAGSGVETTTGTGHGEATERFILQVINEEEYLQGEFSLSYLMLQTQKSTG
jgi:hypothetical protein